MDLYAHLKQEAGKLKLRGLRLLAEGSAESSFEASVTLHAAARRERAASVSLASSLRDARLISAIEECGCYIDAQAPRWANRAWTKIISLINQVDSPDSANSLSLEADTLLTPYDYDASRGLPGLLHYMGPSIPAADIADQRLNRIRDKFFKQQHRFRKAILNCPTLMERAYKGSVVATEAPKRIALERELENLAGRFTGDAHLWFFLFRIRDLSNKSVPALEALWHATKLEPNDAQFRLLHLYAISDIPEYHRTYEEMLNSVFENREREFFEALIFHALSMIRIADSDPRQADNVLRMAQEDLRLAAQKQPLRHGSDDLRKAQFLLNAKLAGKVPSREELVAQGILQASEQGPVSADVAFLMQQQLKHEFTMAADAELRTTA
jgi:hypothetical protein